MDTLLLPIEAAGHRIVGDGGVTVRAGNGRVTRLGGLADSHRHQRT